jgi:hypothetical protein
LALGKSWWVLARKLANKPFGMLATFEMLSYQMVTTRMCCDLLWNRNDRGMMSGSDQ